ncbi:hypothetical protein BX070DRAFT_219318 [Coemansia spiralis]|nr:hypothetical protein BX070DRAFT_219318 [Coemansia spiralis]
MHSTVFLSVFAIVLFAHVHAAPCPGKYFERRQAEVVDANTNSVQDVSNSGTAALTDPDAAVGIPETSLVDTGADNFVGNNFAQIDDTTNIDATNVEYPDDTQMTDNTGTAVSGNNNDVMPIINAPVTVIINSNESKNSKHPSPLAPQITQPQMWNQQQPYPFLYADPAQGSAIDPFSARIQQLVAYALAVGQSRVQGFQ